MDYYESLNHNDVRVRLDALKKLIAETPKPERKEFYVNNHIHTFYSFSPYSPSKAIYSAYKAGLATAGIMDHDSVSGCEEFLEAGEIADMATTIGVELRCDFSKTALNGRRINNTDQESIAYVALHAIPHGVIDMVSVFIKPYAAERNKRNKAMVEKMNALSPLKVDYEHDVVTISKLSEGGSITERHILYALARKIVETGEDIPQLLKREYGIEVTGRLEGFLADRNNPYITYDLLGVLKSTLIEKVYIPASAECPDVTDFISFAKKVGGIAAYAYLGDVGDSVTGDKKTQKYEDEYIELLFDEICRLGFNAVTYMPSRNTMKQLMRVRELCKKHGLMEISGEDINTPRQSFICKELEDEAFRNLVDSTWKLIKHERGQV